MEELDKLKLMMEELTKQNEALRAAAGGVDMSALTAKTASGTDRQAELEKALQEKKTLEAKLAEQEAESRRRQEALQKQQIELKEELAALQEAGMEGLDEAVKKSLLDKQRKLEEQLEAERAKFQSVSARVACLLSVAVRASSAEARVCTHQLDSGLAHDFVNPRSKARWPMKSMQWRPKSSPSTRKRRRHL